MLLQMNDRNLQELFGAQKKADSLNAPNFEELLARPKPVLEKRLRFKQQLRIIQKFSIAASVLLLLSIGVWQFIDFGSQPNQEGLGLEWMENEENILNWEAPSDELLPVESTESIHEPNSLEAIKIERTAANSNSLSADTKEMIEQNPELDEALFKNGSITYWSSPTDFLIEEAQGFNF